MPNPTYISINKNVLISSQASVMFSNIPSTYTDLMLVITSRTDASGAANTDNVKMTINGTSTNYSERIIYAASSGAGSAFSQSAAWINLLYGNSSTATTNTFGSIEIYIPNYAGTTAKQISSTSTAEQNTGGSGYFLSGGAHFWNNTAAITSLAFVPTTGTNFLTGSSFYLYGIKNS